MEVTGELVVRFKAIFEDLTKLIPCYISLPSCVQKPTNLKNCQATFLHVALQWFHEKFQQNFVIKDIMVVINTFIR